MKTHIHIIYFLIICTLIVYFLNKKLRTKNKELFTLSNNFTDPKIENLENKTDQDDFEYLYCKFYDIIFDYDSFYKNDIEEISKICKINKNNFLLDAGCGVGRHYQYLKNKCNVIGCDKSSNMISRCQLRNKNANVGKGNLVNSKIFKDNQFDIILLSLDTLYHNKINAQEIIIKNCKKWLKPKGYLVVHIFDNSKLDPGPRDYSQYYNKKKNALTYFDKFSHDAFWKDIGDNKFEYNEKIIMKDNRSKNFKTILYIPHIEDQIKKYHNNDFELMKKINLNKYGIDDFETYIFINNK